MFVGPPIPGTCEPCPVKTQSPCITDSCGSGEKRPADFDFLFFWTVWILDATHTAATQWKSCGYNRVGEKSPDVSLKKKKIVLKNMLFEN